MGLEIILCKNFFEYDYFLKCLFFILSVCSFIHRYQRIQAFKDKFQFNALFCLNFQRRVRGGNGCKVGDDNGSLMLMWEDGFCTYSLDEEDLVRKAFSKMSIRLYNYGEGWVLLGCQVSCTYAYHFAHGVAHPQVPPAPPSSTNFHRSSFPALLFMWRVTLKTRVYNDSISGEV